MLWEKYCEYVKRFPHLKLWLDTPVLPEAERYLGKERAAQLTEEFTKDYIEQRVSFVTIRDIKCSDLGNYPFQKWSESQGGDGLFRERHQMVYYHLNNEAPLTRAFVPDDNERVSVGEVAGDIEEKHPDEHLVIDVIVTHVFIIRRGGRCEGRGTIIHNIVNN
ncbi:MAG: hypothetical protein K0S38_742 [Candidatus Paceibacter sp.]|jgi:hypothetical protein|nr:hypothetical protein [Candidatus Paceibacter sp.]